MIATSIIPTGGMMGMIATAVVTTSLIVVATSGGRAQRQSRAAAAPMPLACDEFSKRSSELSGKVVTLNGRLVRFEGSVDEKGTKTVGVFACVRSDGIAPQPIVLFAIDAQTTKEENPERVPPNEALWRIQGTVQGSASVGNLQGQKQPVPQLTNVQATLSKTP